MAKIVNNDKGFKVIALSHGEGEALGWGIWTRSKDDTNNECHFLCMHCNRPIEGELYYVAVLGDIMCKDCYEEWLKGAVKYADDTPFEERSFNYCKEVLGL